MPIDAQIPLMVRPAADPLESYGKAMSLSALAGQNRLQQLQVEQATKALDDERTLSDLYRGAIGTDGKLDRQALLSGAASRGLGAKIPALQKTLAEADKATADLDATQIRNEVEKTKFVSDLASRLASNPNVTHDDVIRELAAAPPQFAANAAQFARVLPGDPAQLQRFLAAAGATADKRLELLLPKFQSLDGGNRILNGTVNQMTGQWTQQGAPITKAPEGFTVQPDGSLAADPGFLKAKKDIAAASKTSVVVNATKPLINTVAEGLGKQLDASLDGANAAVGVINNARQLRTLVDSGKLITGPGADARLFMTQLGSMLGITGRNTDEVLANTRAAIQNMAQGELQAAQGMKGQGQITDAERALLKRAASGDINMTDTELRTLSGAMERTATTRIQGHQAQVERLKTIPEFAPLVPFYAAPQVPAAPGAQPAAPAGQPAAPAQPAPAKALTWKDAGYASQAAAVQDGLNAIQRGADKAAVIQRLEAAGIKNHGIK